MHYAFLFISVPSLNDYDVKMPNFTFLVEDANTRQQLAFFFPGLRYSLLELNPRKKLPTFDEMNKTPDETE